MKHPYETLQIVQRHLQKYNNPEGGSCVASGIEMILKLEGLVPESYYKIQDHYKDQNTGFDEFERKIYEGLVFHYEKFSCRDGSIQKIIKNELMNSRYALISLPTGGWHIFLVYLLSEGDFHAVTKWSMPTLPPEPLRINMMTTLCQFFELTDSFDVMTYKEADNALQPSIGVADR